MGGRPVVLADQVRYAFVAGWPGSYAVPGDGAEGVDCVGVLGVVHGYPKGAILYHQGKNVEPPGHVFGHQANGILGDANLPEVHQGHPGLDTEEGAVGLLGDDPLGNQRLPQGDAFPRHYRDCLIQVLLGDEATLHKELSDLLLSPAYTAVASHRLSQPSNILPHRTPPLT